MAVVMAAVAVIRAVDRLERLNDLGHCRAQTLKHRLDDMITLDEDARFLDLCCEMAIAEVPGELDLMDDVSGANFQERFFGGNDFDMAGAVFELQEIAMLQHDRFLEIEHDDIVMRHVQQLAAEMSLVMGEDDDIDRQGGRRAGLDDAG